MEEIWKNINGYEDLYQVSNLGRVKSLSKEGVLDSRGRLGKGKKETILKGSKGKNGYILYSLINKGQNSYITGHRLVAIHFLNNELNKPCVNHINSIRTDNRLENLEWCTYSENMKHASESGRLSKSDNTSSILGRRESNLVINLQTGIYYNSCLEASKFYSHLFSQAKLSRKIRGKQFNDTDFIYA